ncbi:MAG: phosphotransferase [Wenzhouxiangella sp.]|nr:phosphotransferase [Wenzhouxiangella sp.]
MQSSLDRRRIAGLTWAEKIIGRAPESVESISSDASQRRYFRLRDGARTRILMDAPPDREPLTPFLDVARRLEHCVRVPDIVSENVEQGFLLLSDFGSTPYHQALDETSAETLFMAAVDSLLAMQTQARTEGLPAYEPALLMRELDLFTDWFLRRHWQVEPTATELDDWDHLSALLIRWALDQPQVFCHRDFMPRNLMVIDGGPGVIDFQDAVIGPISYDPVCLFRDAFISWPQPQVDRWLEDYRRKALAVGLEVPEDADFWRRTCDFMGVQRHLKVIGIFARIRYRDGKPRYLEDAPRFFAYLDAAIGRNPELRVLGELIRSWTGRRQDR